MWLLHEINPELLRNGLLLISVAGAIPVILCGRFSSRHIAGAFLGFIWQFQARLMIGCYAVAHGWLIFLDGSVRFYGVPIDLIIGESLFLGFLIYSLCSQRPGRYLVISTLLEFIIFSSPLLSVHIGSPLICAIVSILVSSSSYFLSSNTSLDQHIYLRSLHQTLCWMGILAWFLPSLIFQNDNHSWQIFLTRHWYQNFWYLLPLAAPATLIILALKEFAVEGRGTAFPYDPPKKLVATGIYAYISNPMQIGICTFMAWWGAVLSSWPVAASSVIAFFLFIVFKDVCNGSCSISKVDPNWSEYQAEVPKWIPRLKPWSRQGKNT